MRVTERRLAEHTAYETPYFVIEAERGGPAFLITAGIHGNERASVRAAEKLTRMFGDGTLHLRRGTLLIVPVANRKAYRERVRGVPDLNRRFPRRRGESASHPLAAAIFRLAKRAKPRWVLDLHEANGLSSLDPRRIGQCLLTDPDNRAVPAVKRIVRNANRAISRKKNRFTVRLREKPGSSRTAAARLLRARAVTVETSWDLPFSSRVNYQTDMVRQFLSEAGMC
ncbi:MULTISPECIES: succinylglutamate desuccinylase/aspartoacylase family protein [Cohnella]|uniref:succinylglutamate desuccinylase/aspartoacylase family protein n=1 Tax=Cohnella TaxID=329857 RepID=UPI0009BC1590|nr:MULTISPECIES: succinylglutamate desuccinylase/aspartoacylase family protein [Cohnella]MBN2983649.1 succinylglutamate desuccinylase/aspartoacylase family protein [Cohnella algarum]